MLVMDYISDTGLRTDYVRASVSGIDLIKNEPIEERDILLAVSNFIEVNYNESTSNRVCTLDLRPRRLRLEYEDKLYLLDYPDPFTEIDWSIFQVLGAKAETLPEFINESQIITVLRKLDRI